MILTYISLATYYGKYIFNFIRNCPTVVQSCCTDFHSHQKCMVVLSAFLSLAVIGNSYKFCILVLICIFRMINNVEHFFTCSLVTCISTCDKFIRVVCSFDIFIFYFELYIRLDFYRILKYFLFDFILGHLSLYY